MKQKDLEKVSVSGSEKQLGRGLRKNPVFDQYADRNSRVTRLTAGAFQPMGPPLFAADSVYSSPSKL